MRVVALQPAAEGGDDGAGLGDRDAVGGAGRRRRLALALHRDPQVPVLRGVEDHPHRPGAAAHHVGEQDVEDVLHRARGVRRLQPALDGGRQGAAVLGERVGPGLGALGGQVAQRDLGAGDQRPAAGHLHELLRHRVHALHAVDRALRPSRGHRPAGPRAPRAPRARSRRPVSGVRSTWEACSANACSPASRSWSWPALVCSAWLIACASGIRVRGRSRSNRPRPSCSAAVASWRNGADSSRATK